MTRRRGERGTGASAAEAARTGKRAHAPAASGTHMHRNGKNTHRSTARNEDRSSKARREPRTDNSKSARPAPHQLCPSLFREAVKGDTP